VGLWACSGGWTCEEELTPTRADSGVRPAGLVFLAGCPHEGLNDFYVAGAAAEVARNSFPHLLLGWLGAFLDQGLSHHDEAWRAEATLTGSAGCPLFLEGGEEGTRLDAFDRAYVGSLTVQGEGKARQSGLALDLNGAAAAGAHVTSSLCAGQTGLVAEDVQQECLLINGSLPGSAIDFQAEDLFLRSFCSGHEGEDTIQGDPLARLRRRCIVGSPAAVSYSSRLDLHKQR
jgi:hypothetical protein